MGDDEEFIYYGTALPDLEDEFAHRKKVARELEVRDEKGRQRFHGAFTGGFSAGYFNTVGTKEGWTPSSFVSSRNKSAGKIQQNPEDFMDEEDLGEFGIASRRIHTSSKFKDAVDDTKKRKFTELDNVIPGTAPLKDIVKPVRETIGIEILKKLGWRPGQGIGPRIKKQDEGPKIYGCSLPGAMPAEKEIDPSANLFTFAPSDTEGMIYRPKDNLFGIGYTGLSKQSVLKPQFDEFSPTSTKTWLKKDKKKLTISGQAFGVGAFEDDDDDIYSKDDMSQYDFSSFLEKSSHAGNEKNKESTVLKSVTSVLEGFHLSTHPPLLKKRYPPPDLPNNYNPQRCRPKEQSQIKPLVPSNQRMTPDCRSLLLGEKKFVSSAAKDETSKNVTIESLPDKSVFVTSSLTNRSQSFRPFQNDELKQKRYEEFLKLKHSGVKDLQQPPSMTEWEKQQECEEFKRAAILFRPLSSTLSSKFESRSSLSVDCEINDALEKAKNEKNQKPLEKRILIGKSNRKIIKWHPISLLCKRFNVPNPYPNTSDEANAHSSKSIFSHLSFSSQSSNSSDRNIPTSLVITTSEPASNIEIADRTALPKSDVIVPSVQLDVKKPPIDFFKDIFENSSSEDENEDSNQVDENTSLAVASETKTESIETSELILPVKAVSESKTDNKRVGFGVFANIDLDALNQRTKVKPINAQNILPFEEKIITDNTELNNSAIPEKETQICPDNTFGPELPPNYSESTTLEPAKYRLKKHKSKHSHKHAKSKSKKKKKKKTQKSSDENTSDEDIPPSVILEKLKKLHKAMKSNLR